MEANFTNTHKTWRDGFPIRFTEKHDVEAVEQENEEKISIVIHTENYTVEIEIK